MSYDKERLRAILDSMEDGVYVVNGNFDLEYVNHALEAVFGPAQGQKCFRYLHGLSQICSWCRNSEILKGKHIHWELRFPKNGRIYAMTGTPLRNPDGSLSAQEILHDITTRKRIDEELRQDEMRLESLLEIANYEAKYIQTLLDFALEKAIALTGSKIGYIYHYDEDKEEFILNTWSKEVMGECRITSPQTIYQLEKTGIWGEAVRQRMPIVVNDFQSPNPLKKGYPEGHVQISRFLTVPVFVDGKVIAVVGVANKENEYNQADERQLTLLADAVWKIVGRKQAEERLRQSEERLERSQEIAHLGSWELDLLTNSLSWSDEVYRIFGLNPLETAASYNNFLEAIHPDDRANVDAAYSGSVKEGKDSYEIEHRIVRKSTGEIRYVHEKCQHFRDENGKIIRSLGMVHDITESRKANEALQQYARDLELANGELEAFSYSVSHDLRAPLRRIDGFSQAIIEEYAERLDEQGRAYLESIKRSGQLMSQLIDGMLWLSRIVKAELQLKRVDISDLARQVIQELKSGEPDREVEFSIVDGVDAFGDANLLRSVLENLLGNAFKFTAGRRIARISFGISKADGENIYYISDNGAGFDMKYSDKLFEPFQRLHSNSEYKGTGVGLAIVQRIILRHGGKVWAEGEKGKGATFYFTLNQKRIEKTFRE